MNINLKRFILLSICLILVLLPIWQALSQIEALHGGKAGFITLGIFLLLTIAYWVFMIIYIKKTGNKDKK